MSYTPTNWKTGDVVSSERLNKLEEGVKDAYSGMVINDNAGTLDKTWQEVYDAMSAGIPCYIQENVSFGPGVFINRSYVEYVGSNMTDYTVRAIAFVNGQVSIFAYGTSSPNGYPVSKDN